MLQVTYLTTPPYRHAYSFPCVKEFDDPFDFIDWIKQRNLAGHGVTIIHWNYRRT